MAGEASQYGISAVIIYKVMPNNTEQPIAYTSRPLSSTEKVCTSGEESHFWHQKVTPVPL